MGIEERGGSCNCHSPRIVGVYILSGLDFPGSYFALVGPTVEGHGWRRRGRAWSNVARIENTRMVAHIKIHCIGFSIRQIEYRAIMASRRRAWVLWIKIFGVMLEIYLYQVLQN